MEARTMSLIRYNPRRDIGSLWRPFSDLQSEINRLFGDSAPTAVSFAPALDVFEKDDSLVVKADLPGVKPEDLSISIHEGVLTLSGKREHEEEVKKDSFFYVERSFGSFSRSIQLPIEVDADKVKANFNGGILTVTAPKSERAKPKTIEVSVN